MGARVGAGTDTQHELLKERYEMAGVSEKKAEAAHRQGVGYAKHLGVPRGTKRWRRIVYGTKRSKGWIPQNEVATHALRMHKKRS